jgi:O-methyltransferase
LAVSLEEVADNFRRFGLWSDQVRLVKGWFKDTVPAAPVEKIAVLRLDVDHRDRTKRVNGS